MKLAGETFAAGDLNACRAHCKELLRLASDNAEALELLGQVESKANDPTAAIALFERAVRADSRRGSAWRRLAEAQRFGGDHDAARATLHLRCNAAPEDVDAWVALSSLFAEARNLREAESLMERCVAANPGNGHALVSLGVLRIRQLNWSGAKDAFESALALEPESVPATKHLAFICEISGEIARSSQLLDQAIAFGGGDADIFLQASRVARRGGDAPRAIEFARQGLQFDPARADVHYQLGCALWDKGDIEGAGEAFGATCDLDPENACARWAFAMTAIPATKEEAGEAIVQRFADRLEFLEGWLTQARARNAVDALGTFTPFFLAYVECDNRALLSRYGDLCARVMGAYLAATGTREVAPPTPRRTLRVGIVSAHMFGHSVWQAMLKGWFVHLDRSIVSLYAYALRPVHDVETDMAKSRAEKFVQLDSRDHNVWANAILQDDLDAIIYPEIGMNGVAVQLACRRLAPVQIAAWGHPETSGLPEIDYFLSGQDFEPDNARAFYREKLIPLPHLGVFFEPPGERERPAPLSDAELGLLGVAPHRPLLLCPGTPFKYSSDHDELYVRIASRLPAAQMVFFDDGRSEMGMRLRERLSMRFAEAGIDFDDHVVTIPWLESTQWHGVLDRATALLDTVGFSGFNTAAQALAANVPVVAWDGKFLRGRLASGLLRRMGLHDWIARDVDGFIARLARLCEDSDLRRALTAQIAARKHRAFNDLEPVRELERFLVATVGR
jgi:predicted O-linked N-acetylglucosamine transferase (SPINDLY family)